MEIGNSYSRTKPFAMNESFETAAVNQFTVPGTIVSSRIYVNMRHETS